MSQYNDGTVDVTYNSTQVVGHSTAWSTYVSAGDLFKLDDEAVVYQISNVVGNTEITLSSAYAGATATYQDYQITTDFTSNLQLPEIHLGDLDWPDWYNRALDNIDTYLCFSAAATTPTTKLSSGRPFWNTTDKKLWVYDSAAGGSWYLIGP